MSDNIADKFTNFLETLSSEQKAALLDQIMSSMDTNKAPEYKRIIPEEKPKTTDDGLYVMNKDSSVKVNKVPVTEGRRFNKFKDDGTEHKDQQNETPQVSLTERRRPAFKKVNQTCQRCSTTLEVHPQFARDFFVCDKCLRK